MWSGRPNHTIPGADFVGLSTCARPFPAHEPARRIIDGSRARWMLTQMLAIARTSATSAIMRHALAVTVDVPRRNGKSSPLDPGRAKRKNAPTEKPAHGSTRFFDTNAASAIRRGYAAFVPLPKIEIGRGTHVTLARRQPVTLLDLVSRRAVAHRALPVPGGLRARRHDRFYRLL
jgi:hypothetical protein